MIGQNQSGFGSPPPDRTQRLLIDCTRTMKMPVVTGIQRVVRNLIRHGLIVGRSRGLDVVPIHFTGRGFEPAPLSAAGELVSPAREGRTRRTAVVDRLRKIFINPRVENRLRATGLFMFSRPAPGRRFDFRSDDILLLPDSTWTENIWPEVDRARDRGLVLGVLQHDFIPVRHPELVSTHGAAAFRRWMKESLTRADFVLAVSRTTAEECRTELRGLHRRRIADECVVVCPNGADFTTDVVAGTVRRELGDFVRAGAAGAYFTLGTLEPRKNQGLIVDALDEILAACPEERFLIAGRVGWNGGGIAGRIRGHARYGTNLLLLDDLTDAELAHVYGHAKAVVFPSLAEGFGLPIVESLARGTRVFASDIPVHREVGGDSCVYFDPTSRRDLAELLIGHSRDGRFPACWPPCGLRLPTWQAAAETMVAAAISHAAAVRAFAPHVGPLTARLPARGPCIHPAQEPAQETVP